MANGAGMPEDSLRYDRLVEDALRSVVGKALTHVVEHGLPGEHHFYITFHTDHPGVVIPDRLRERYPSEMTIVLQHQFWDLVVEADGFAVGLSFSDVPARLSIPFAAVVAFADPSVRFGLQFDVGEGETAERDEAQGPGAPDAPSAASAAGGGKAKRPGPAMDMDPTMDMDKVVTLDTFRKK